MLMRDDGIRENRGKPIETLMQECRGYYNPHFAAIVCEGLGLSHALRAYTVESLDAFMKFFEHPSERLEFLATYLEDLKRMAGSLAPCACPPRVGNEACEHDWIALFAESDIATRAARRERSKYACGNE